MTYIKGLKLTFSLTGQCGLKKIIIIFEVTSHSELLLAKKKERKRNKKIKFWISYINFLF